MVGGKGRVFGRASEPIRDRAWFPPGGPDSLLSGLRSSKRPIGDLGPGGAERLEVVDPGLVDQDVAVGEIEDPLLGAAFPEAPNDLERGEGFAGAGRHDEEDSIPTFGDGFDGSIDGRYLVVAGRFAAAVVVVVLRDDRLGRIVDPLPLAIAAPKVGGRGELVQGEFAFDLTVGRRFVVLMEGVTVRAVGESQVEHFRVAERLLKAIGNGMVVVLGFDDGEREVRLEVENVVGPLLLSPLDRSTLDDHPAGSDRLLLAELRLHVPPGIHDGRRDELRADIALAQSFLVEGLHGPFRTAEFRTVFVRHSLQTSRRPAKSQADPKV